MNKKNKILVIVLVTVILGFGVFNPSVLAESKKQLAHLVMEHEFKIATLEELVKSLSADSRVESNENFTPEVKEALTKEVEIRLPDFTTVWEYDAENDTEFLTNINVSHFELNEVNGKVTLQIYTEGQYDWKATVVETSKGKVASFGVGRDFAQNFIFNFDPIPKMYGIDLRYEFYQNGERIRLFINVD